MLEFVMISITKLPLLNQMEVDGPYFFKPEPEKLSLLNTICGYTGKMYVSHFVS